MTGAPPCSECTGSCCVSYDIIALQTEEIERFGGKQILIGTNGCQYLENGRCSIHQTRPQVCRDFDCRNVTSSRELRLLTINGAPKKLLKIS